MPPDVAVTVALASIMTLAEELAPDVASDVAEAAKTSSADADDELVAAIVALPSINLIADAEALDVAATVAEAVLIASADADEPDAPCMLPRLQIFAQRRSLMQKLPCMSRWRLLLRLPSNWIPMSLKLCLHQTPLGRPMQKWLRTQQP